MSLAGCPPVPCALTACHLSLSQGERATLSPGEKPLNPRAPTTSHPLSAEMALPTAALRKAGAGDEPLCHSHTSQWTHIFTFSHARTHTHTHTHRFLETQSEKVPRLCKGEVNGGCQCIVLHEHNGCADIIVGPVFSLPLSPEKSTNWPLRHSV